jgi:hypothetical protein
MRHQRTEKSDRSEKDSLFTNYDLTESVWSLVLALGKGAAMLIKIITLPFSSACGGFHDEELVEFLRDLSRVPLGFDRALC